MVGYKEIEQKDKQLFFLETGQSFGEMALLSDQLRMCSIKAVENTDLIVVTKDMYTQYEGNSRALYLYQTENFLHENFLFNKIGKETRVRIAQKSFIKVFEPNKVIQVEGEKVNYFCIIKFGQVSMRKHFLKENLNRNKINKAHMKNFSKLKPSFDMEISTKENSSYFGGYEVFYKIPSFFTVMSKTKVSVILLASNELFQILSADDVNIIKKNILKPFEDEDFINFFLEHQYWESFKKKVIYNELK